MQLKEMFRSFRCKERKKQDQLNRWFYQENLLEVRRIGDE